MTRFAYLGALLVSLGGLAVIDRRWRLAFWVAPRRAALSVGLGVLAFLAWDLAGLALGIFARGDSPHMTGVLLAPELPLEEAFFLALLCYTALLAWRAVDRRAARPRHDGTVRGGARPRDGARPPDDVRPPAGARPPDDVRPPAGARPPDDGPRP